MPGIRRVAGSVLRTLRLVGAQDLDTLYNQQTHAVIHKACASDATCIDVGCHRGEILDVMLGAAPLGQHFGFEPIPAFYESLRARYDEPGRARILNVALSNVKGHSTFHYVKTNPAYSGLRRRQYPQVNEEISTIDATTDLLDGVLPSNQRVDLIKIDVEGAELQVLEGALNTIRRTKPVIVFEHGVGAADWYGTRPEQVHDLLVQRAGLAISLMSRWLNADAPFTKDEFVREFDQRRNYYYIAYPP